VAPLPKKQVSDGGIHLLEQYNDDQKQYRVLSVGPKVKEIRPGDCVLANLYTDVKHHFEDRSMLIDADQCVAVWTTPTPAQPAEAQG
jgi:hypothetical protein